MRNIAYFLTDGSVEVNREGTFSEAAHAVDEGIRVIPIGVAMRHEDEIKHIAEMQNIPLITIDNIAGFDQLMNDGILLEAVHDSRSFV